ncbi:pyrroloquinoline quinone biosynthesis protein PqqB [Mucilaginibacter mali]|uniref:Pyrroloquinoline quinone biosynthesis protein PqqB n=1 Tax=Mucilaginibacter mali TaxID=2740462 RepID=A0A7D4TNQ4_9SPHI|nr:MBL fold metallo-hydrolase [Mucilaginibacter mali]QKJ31193.1 pyrroloquinoline quinone biosynthesis protein PqqB [Mucilaginibacter mali]
MKKLLLPFFLLIYMVLTAYQKPGKPAPVSLIVLGTIQDGGSPHMGCNKNCCRYLFTHPDYRRKVVSLGVIDSQNQQTWLFEATPDMPAQAKMLKIASGFQQKETPDGIFVTHAHIGHYTGLMYLGKEALNSKSVPTYAMPRMKTFLENNGPWNQLVSINNIALQALQNEQPVILSNNIKVTPIIVPHRDELSETVGYKIEGPNKKILFIPDINKWALWNKDIIHEIAGVNYAFVDGTFYSGEEIQTRNIAEIPHPFIIESMKLLAGLPAREKAKVYFIHFNHTNPVIDPKSPQALTVLKNGFRIAQFGQRVEL